MMKNISSEKTTEVSEAMRIVFELNLEVRIY
jgi:hypothetical protein